MDGSFVELIVIFGPYQHDLEAKKEPSIHTAHLQDFRPVIQLPAYK